MLYGGHAIEARGGRLIQNCEVGYMGAMTHTFVEDITIYSGDGISHATHMITQNNYVHHVFNGGIAAGELSFAGNPDAEDYVDIQGYSSVSGNLLEYTCGITLLNWEQEVNLNHMFKNITIADNYVMYSSPAGNPDGKKANDVIGALVFTGHDIPTPCANENLVIKDNVLFLSKNALILSGMPKEYYPVYSGNTYVQYADSTLAYWCFEDGTFGPVSARELSESEDFIRNSLGDKTGTVIHWQE